MRRQLTMEEAFKQFKVGDRIRFTGFSSYSYFEGKGSTICKNEQKGELGTVIQTTDHLIVIKLDKIDGMHQKHRTKSDICKEWDGIDILPSEHYANVSLGDYCCGDKYLVLAEEGYLAYLEK